MFLLVLVLNSLPIHAQFNNMIYIDIYWYIRNVGILKIRSTWILWDLPWDFSLEKLLSFRCPQEGLPPVAKEARLKIELTEGHRIRPRFSGKLGIISGSWTCALRCFWERGQVVDSYASWLWIGRFFESSQDCEFTHVKQKTFNEKGWVIKLSVRQNFAVRNAGV